MDQARPYVSMGGPVFFVFFTPDAAHSRRGLTQLVLLGKIKPGLSFEMRLLCPAGTEAFIFCSLGRLRRGQMGAC